MERKIESQGSVGNNMSNKNFEVNNFMKKTSTGGDTHKNSMQI
jgi:hypothetical protein